MRGPIKLIMAGFLLLALHLVGCSGKAPVINYYSLLPGGQQSLEPAADSQQLSVGVGPVRLPLLLKRPQLVTRTANHQVLHAEYERWSGDLQEEVSHALIETLSRQLATTEILGYPWPKRFRPDWQVRIDIRRLDGELGKAAYLEAQWSLTSGDNGDLVSGFSSLSEATDGSGYEALVAAEARLLASLAREIAQKMTGP